MDIQSVLDGAERFECAHAPSLETELPYDAAKDLQTYRTDTQRPVGVDVRPGAFVALFPDDAHMAALIVGERSQSVKKVVVKVRAELLEAP